MNYTQLREALKLEGGSLTIAASTLTPNIAGLLSDCNAGQPIVIANALPGVGDDRNETVVVKGQSNFLNVADLPLELRAVVDADGNAQLFLKYTLPEAWHFSSSFPALPKVVGWNKPLADPLTIPLDDLPLFSPYFVVVSQNQTEPDFNVELKPGINFVSRVGPAKIVEIVESVFGHSLPFVVYGTIRLPKPTDASPALTPLQFPWGLESPVPGILLQADLGLETAIGPMKLDDLSFRIYSPTTDEWLKKNEAYKPVMAYSGKLNIPSAKLELDVVAPMEPGSTELLLLGNFQGVSVAKLEDLLDLAGTGDLLSRLPDQLKQAGDALGKLELTHAGISFSLTESERGIGWVSFTIGLPERKWTVWADHFEIDRLACRFEVTDPFKSDAAKGNGGPPPGQSKFEVSVSGTFQIEGVPVNVRANNRDGFTAYAELTQKQTIPLGQLMDTYLPGVPAPGDLTIDTLRLSVEPHKSYSMALSVSDWKIPLGTSDLRINEAYVSMGRTQDGQTNIELRGVMNVAGVRLQVLADRKDGGWKLRGKTDDQQSISFTHLLDELLRPCGISVPSNLPTGLGDLTFKNLSISYDTTSKDFEFGAESADLIPVNFGKQTRGADTELDLRITTDANSGKRKYSGYLRSEITLGGAPFKCEYDFGNGSMIKATWDGADGSLDFAGLTGAHAITHALQIPDSLSLNLKRAAFEYDFGNGKMILTAESNHGQAFFVASNANDNSDGAGKATDKKWDFVFGVLVDFSELGIPSLGVTLKDSVLILSTVQDDKFSVPTLPDLPPPPGQPSTALTKFPTIGAHKL